jgi:chemotaxis protein CheY-P-specific phosphatase CheC
VLTGPVTLRVAGHSEVILGRFLSESWIVLQIRFAPAISDDMNGDNPTISDQMSTIHLEAI